MKLTACILFLLLCCTFATAQPTDIDAYASAGVAINVEAERWMISWGDTDCCGPVAEGEESYLALEGGSEREVGFMELPVALEGYPENYILTLEGEVRTSGVRGRGAGLNLKIMGAEGQILDHAQTDLISGTEGWRATSLRIVLPDSSATIRLGAILFGAGQAHFRGFRLRALHYGDRRASRTARRYARAASRIIGKHSLYADEIDLGKLRKHMARISGPADSPSDTYLAVEYALNQLRHYGDNHSFFMPAARVKEWEENDEPFGDDFYPTVSSRDGIAYVSVPAFSGNNDSLKLNFADSLLRGLQSAYAANPRGWVVDLRGNTGGNMEPMIAGLGPLLDDVPLGALVDVRGDQERWAFVGGEYRWNDVKGSVNYRDWTPDRQLPIAVLWDGRTGSSGEIVALSFVGNTRSRTFGEKTWGLTTGNGDFALPDGSLLFLASTRMVDRFGKHSPDGVLPDVSVTNDPKTEQDDVYQAALRWIGDR